MRYSKHLILFLLLIKGVFLFGQEIQHDSSMTKMRKNIIRWNLTPRLLFGDDNWIFGYERVVKPHQSFSINAGYLSLPKFLNLGLSKFYLKRQTKNYGYSIAADYRFYTKKRNRGFAPDGLYIGPFVTSYNLRFENEIGLVDSVRIGNSRIIIDGQINVVHVGIELGYQFIFKQRLALDLIMIGPGVGFYNAKLEGSGQIDIDDKLELYNDLKDAIINEYPGIDGLLRKRSVSSNGRYSLWSAGLRFVVQVGYLF